MHRLVHTDLPDDREFSFTRDQYIFPWDFCFCGCLLWLEHEILRSIDDLFEIDLLDCFGDIFSYIVLVPFLYRHTETRYIRNTD